MSREAAELARECAALGKALGLMPSAGCVLAYGRALERVLPANNRKPEDEAAMAAALTGAWDLEALELAWRRRDPSNPLTLRMNVLAYLLEADPANFDRFVATRPARLRAYVSLAVATLRSLYLRAKGRWLLARWQGLA